MKKIIYSFLFLTLFSIHLNFAQDLSKLSDGPFIFIEDEAIIEKTIKDGEVVVGKLENFQYDTIYTPNKSYFNNVSKIAALSDIHGQYGVLVKLLKIHNIIDDNLCVYDTSFTLITPDPIFANGTKVDVSCNGF